jgi:hypothetical protein
MHRLQRSPVQSPAQTGIEALGSIDIRHRNDHNLQHHLANGRFEIYRRRLEVHARPSSSRALLRASAPRSLHSFLNAYTRGSDGRPTLEMLMVHIDLTEITFT